MDCRDFLGEFSEYYDGLAPEPVVRAAEDHLASCPRCRRYARTLAEGTALLRAIPPLEPSPDFRARLEGRLAGALGERWREGADKGSGASVWSLAVLTVLLVLSAWAPFLDRPPLVDLPAIVAARPLTPPGSHGGSASPGLGRLPLLRPAEFPEGIWGESHTLLYRYSRLSGRYRSSALFRAGVQ